MSIQAQSTIITVRLREAIEAYRKRTGEHLTYQQLADQTGIARATIESLATRAYYNASLRTIAKLCAVLECAPADLLVLSSRDTVGKKRRK